MAKILDSEPAVDKALEVGCGSGILTVILASKAGHVVATDSDPEALRETKRRIEENNIENVDLICCDIAKSVRTYFDLIISNPPYLPSSERSDPTVEGGKNGSEFLQELLIETARLIKSKSKLLIMYSSSTAIDRVWSLARKLDLNHAVITSRKLFFEEVFVAKLFR